MAELLSNKPVLTLVMGGNGAGKSAWKRANYDQLPEYYLDQDSIAGGFGDWNNTANRERTRVRVDAELNHYFAQRLDFGMETTFSGIPGRELMQRAIEAGYSIRGVFIGTNDPAINIARIEYRVRAHLGHEIDPARIPNRYRYSLSNLRKNFHKFDELELIDNSLEDVHEHQPQPILQCEARRGAINEIVARDDMANWCQTLLNRLDNMRALEEQQQEKRN